MIHSNLTAAFILMIGTNCVFAQTDFFWSDKGLGEGAVNAPLQVEAIPGEPVDLYLYYTTNGPTNSDISVGLSVDLSVDGGLNFVSAETLDFDIMIVSNKFFTRWGNNPSNTDLGVFGETGTISDNAVEGLKCFGAIGDGIIEGNTGPIFMDQGYDEAAEAFLVAKVKVQTTTFDGAAIFASVGEELIIDDSSGEIKKLNPVFGCVTVGLGPGPSKNCSVQGPLLGDLNRDGQVSLLDIVPFLNTITNVSFQPEGDINQDGVINLLDVAGFVNLLRGMCAEFDGEPLEPGDMNCDGCIDILDAAQLREYIVANGSDEDPNICNFETADLNGDGEVDLLDIIPLNDLIQKK